MDHSEFQVGLVLRVIRKLQQVDEAQASCHPPKGCPHEDGIKRKRAQPWIIKKQMERMAEEFDWEQGTWKVNQHGMNRMTFDGDHAQTK